MSGRTRSTRSTKSSPKASPKKTQTPTKAKRPVGRPKKTASPETKDDVETKTKLEKDAIQDSEATDKAKKIIRKSPARKSATKSPTKQSPRSSSSSPEKKEGILKETSVTVAEAKFDRLVRAKAEGKDMQFPCELCPISFSTMAGLKRHERKCKALFAQMGEKSIDSGGDNDSQSEDNPPDGQPEFRIVNPSNYKNGESGINCYCCGEDVITCHTVGDFKCLECNKLFKLEISLNRHIQNVHTRPDINALTSNTDGLIELSTINHSEGGNKLIDTAGGSTTIDCFCCGENLLTAHTTGNYECHECGKKFQLKASVDRHLKVMHQQNSGSHLCPQCGIKCPDKGTLARHMYTHTGLKPYSCPVCNQEFSRKYHLVRHNMQTGCDGTMKPVFPCQVCGREFNRKDNLREHLRAHAGQTKRKKMFSCDTCDMEFCGTNLLQIHKRSHTGEKPYWCDFCPKKFSSGGALKKHRRTHTGERPYECQICNKRFGAKETLNRHTRIHTGYKPHCCQYCGKRFIQSSQLKSHLFYHTGQSVLQPAELISCEICDKKFNRRARLNEHMKYVHLGAKPFECTTCGKTFIRKEDLNRHLIIHSGIKAHKCPICSKAFAMKSSLKVHLLTHTKEQPRSCDECGRAFIRQDCLLRHMRNKHRDMLEKIMSEAEKKKLQQQLLQMAAETNQIVGLEDKRELTEEALNESVRELLGLLVDEATLQGLGWPQASVHQLLEAVIRRCGHEPAPSLSPMASPTPDQLRHNVKLLFTVVIDDSAVKALLNNQTVDEVILHVLRLAKS